MTASRGKSVIARMCVPLLLFGAGCSAAASPSPPTSASERPVFAGTKTEWTQAMATCMQKKGVKATFRVDGEGVPTVEVNDPNDRGDGTSPGRIAWDTCQDELPVRPEPTSDADFKVMYDNLVAQSKCVQDEGYEIPPVPSWQSFLEQARAKDVDWDPTLRVPVQLRALARKACVDQDKWW